MATKVGNRRFKLFNCNDLFRGMQLGEVNVRLVRVYVPKSKTCVQNKSK